MLVSGAIEEPPLTKPPAAPVLGACYIVAADATDGWAGKAQCVACWISGGWRFVPPAEGMFLFERSSGNWAAFRSGGWEIGSTRGSFLFIDGEQVVGPKAAAIGSPSGGALVDSEARAALEAVLGALRGHGLIAS
jgi:hypothetical protein